MGRITDRSRDLPAFGTVFPRAAAVLEIAIQDVLSAGWNEPERRHAHEVAAALGQGALAAGWKGTGEVLESITSLLALPADEAQPLREALRGKFVELLDLLRQKRASESA